MNEKEKRKRQLGTPANIIASAFNLPVMTIAGLFIGSIISASFTSPLREFIIIGTTLVFFVIAMVELYLISRLQSRKENQSTLTKEESLRKLILDNQEKSE